jgi:GNAT superfamily N-acetyltransferase
MCSAKDFHPMRFSVRHAVPDDAPQLSRLARRAKAHWDYPSEWLAAWRPQLTIEPRYLIEHRVLVAESAGRLIGMCALEDRDTCWSLEHVWVDPGSMGQGVGRTLVQQALDLAGSVRPGRVVAEADPHATGFYRRMGASEIGVVPASMPGAPDRVLTVFAFVVG